MPNKRLNPKQQAFILEYIRLGNATQAYINAGYACNYKTAKTNSNNLLSKNVIQEEIRRLRKEDFQKNVATSEEVMDFFSKVMRGEVKDQFGLETSVADRIKAGQELAKRTIDIDNKKLGLGDNVLEIRLDWRQPQEIGVGAQEAEYEVLEE